LTIVAMVFGGGGSPAPRPELVVQLAVAAGILGWVFLPRDNPEPIDWKLLALAAAILLLPAIQLIPLPPSIWQALPGRAVEVESLALIGEQDSWMPWSISPPLTLAALLAMIPAVTVMLMVSRLDLAGRKAVIATIAVVGVVSIAIGTLQLAAGPSDWVTFYPDSNGRVFGFQANRNAEVDVLMIAMVAGVASFAWLGRRSAAAFTVAGAYVLLMVLGAVLTASRAGIALLPLALLFVGLIVYRGKLGIWHAMGILVAAIAALFIGALLLRDNAALARVATRFTGVEDFRFELWTDTLYAIKQYWPVGSGMGTLVPVLIGVERLEVVDPTLPNRAHNDFLELALEGGVFGLLILTLAAGLVLLLAWRAWRLERAALRPMLLFASAALVIVALHSIVDYPLRSMALAHLAGVAAGLFVPPLRGSGSSPSMREFTA
jgi:O-antigen ligase